jgi:hypothetical protein
LPRVLSEHRHTTFDSTHSTRVQVIKRDNQTHCDDITDGNNMDICVPPRVAYTIKIQRLSINFTERQQQVNLYARDSLFTVRVYFFSGINQGEICAARK